MKSLILMTSYNGEKYIGKQIESIINQTFKNWNLIIRDDGSTDKTIDIIEEYIASNDRISLLRNLSDRHGAYLNFFTLIQHAKSEKEYDYYFFADQDDIWLEDKLEKMITCGEMHKDIPLLVYGDMQVIDGNDDLVYSSIDDVMGIGEISGMSLFFTHGFLWGCDVMVNHLLFELVPVFPLTDVHIDIMSHDNYFGKFAYIVGKIIYLPEPCIQHRRHGDNETGSYSMWLSPIKIFKRFFLETDNLAQTHARVYNQTLQTINQMQVAGYSDQRLDEIRNGIVHGGLKGVKVLRKYKVKRKQRARTIGIYFIMLSNRYKEYLVS